MVDRWHTDTLANSPTLRAHAYSLLRTVLESARTDGMIDANPCAIDGAGSADRKIKPRPLSIDELEVIAAEMPDNLRAMALLAVWCAMRFGELVELRRGDIEGDLVKVRRGAVRVGGQWVIGPPKSEAGVRDVVMPPNILPAIEYHLKNHTRPGRDALLFPAKSGGHLQPSTLYRHFYKARATANRPDLRWHDLRHSGAVLAARAGGTLAELMARLGHSTPQAAMRYQHAAQGRDRQIAVEMSKLALPDTP
jgi:integrase